MCSENMKLNIFICFIMPLDFTLNSDKLEVIEISAKHCKRILLKMLWYEKHGPLT